MKNLVAVHLVYKQEIKWKTLWVFWENEKSHGNTASRKRVFPQLFEFSQTSTRVTKILWKQGNKVFYFFSKETFGTFSVFL